MEPNLSMLTLDAFQAWLTYTETTCEPCSAGTCVLAEWLKDEDFKSPHVDGEEITALDEHDWRVPVMKCEPWMERIVDAFDGIGFSRAELGHTRPLLANEYKPTLLALCNVLRAEDKECNSEQS